MRSIVSRHRFVAFGVQYIVSRQSSIRDCALTRKDASGKGFLGRGQETKFARRLGISCFKSTATWNRGLSRNRRRRVSSYACFHAENVVSQKCSFLFRFTTITYAHVGVRTLQLIWFENPYPAYASRSTSMASHCIVRTEAELARNKKNIEQT